MEAEVDSLQEKMQVVRTRLSPLKCLDGCLKLPGAKGAVFAELLPTVAVRRVAGNSTLYSVVYRRPMTKTGKKRSAVVSSPLIVTVYQSHLRAKKFDALLKMKVDVRLTTDDKSHRYGVAVAVDEVAECVYVAYTRDEAPVGKRPAPGTRLLLRRIKLTLAAADARGVRRLQRPGRQGVSKTFEAKAYVIIYPAGTPLKLMANRLAAEEGPIVQQLALDKGTLLLFSQWVGSTALKVKDKWAVALLKLNEKRCWMDVHSLPPIGDGLIYGQGRCKYMARLLYSSPRDMRANVLASKPYLPAPCLNKLGTVADAACRPLEDAMQKNSAARQQIVCGKEASDMWFQTCACRRHQVFHSNSRLPYHLAEVVAVRGLATVAPRPQIVCARFAGYPRLAEWQARNTKLGRLVGLAAGMKPPPFTVSGSWLLTLVWLQSARRPTATKLVILRASLRSLLPPKTVCANCDAAIRPSLPDKKKVCKVCLIRGFGKYSWVFGCHFCSAACLRDAWPQHSRLHQTPPLRKWTDADWQEWRRDNSKP